MPWLRAAEPDVSRTRETIQPTWSRSLPWIVSFWVTDPGWKLNLWIVGLGMTLYFSVLFGRDGSAQVVDLRDHEPGRLWHRTAGPGPPLAGPRGAPGG